MELPRVTVIIPHWNGEDFLRRCLVSLSETTYSAMDVLVVDNHSTDNSVMMVRTEFPKVRIVENSSNLGYVGGCNVGIAHSKTPFFVLLNNDTEVTPEWLVKPMQMMQQNIHLAAIQPKLLSLINKDQFDYCGGAGGELDVLGYPITWGRVFDYIENDNGQYNQARSIFWATGAACIIRRSAVDNVGILDVSFFAHMEEIDLCWRFHLAGYDVAYCPDSTVYHYNGGTLGAETLQKMVLNHRNSQIMILKNYELRTLLWLYPLRLVLESITVIGSLLRGDFKRLAAVFIAFAGTLKLQSAWRVERKKVQKMRRISDSQLREKMINHSVAIGYYFRKKVTVKDFKL